jgi:hypothetical protein
MPDLDPQKRQARPVHKCKKSTSRFVVCLARKMQTHKNFWEKRKLFLRENTEQKFVILSRKAGHLGYLPVVGKVTSFVNG